MTDTSARVDRVCTVFNNEYPLVLWYEGGRNPRRCHPDQPRRGLIVPELTLEGVG